MSDENIVITVRLSDVDEPDQPDPICLPADEMTTWRHFEALLQSMYRDPPSQIRVWYLDEDSDWVRMGSDAELKDAVKVAQGTDAILQIQVKRKDSLEDTYYESTLPSEGPLSSQMDPNDPHVSPLPFDTTYTLSYPYPPCPYPITWEPSMFSPPIPPDAWRCVYPLVYPHPDPTGVMDPTLPGMTGARHTAVDRPNENVILMGADGRTSHIENRPDLSTEEKVKRLKDRCSNPGGGRDDRSRGPNTFREMFEQAAGFSSEDKVKFMKNMLTGQSSDEETDEEEFGQMSGLRRDELGETYPETRTDCRGAGVRVGNREESEIRPALLIEPLSSNMPELRMAADTPLTVQDPFDVISHDRPSRDLEQIQLNLQPGAILTPEKPRESTSPAKDGGNVVVGDQVPSIPVAPNTRPTGGAVPPVPLLYTLQMMDGAQSGANAVAIEIPEGDHHGAAQKEEDVTASGGASCTSASAETGESIGNRSCHDGAAVGDKVKVCSSSQTTFQPSKAAPKKSKRSGDSSPSKAVPKDSEKGKGEKEAVPKEGKKAEKKVAKETKETCSVGNKIKEKGSGDGASKTEADVESGEKIIKRKRSKSSTLQTKDFVKLMTKMQTELHSGIVKDVSKQTDRLLRKTFSRSSSYESSLSNNGTYSAVVHKGIYCDNCNVTIRGIRFKCGNCPDFDFCEKCESSLHSHDPSHVFLKLYRPVTQAGKVGAENVPLLREVIYKQDGCLSEDVGEMEAKHLEDVPILSISEVTTPGRKLSPPSTPSESHKKGDVSNWVWDSAFDTDKHLYSLDGDAELRFVDEDGQPKFGDSDMKRLYALLSIEARAAEMIKASREDLIVELPKTPKSSLEMAASLDVLHVLPTTNLSLATEADSSPLSPPPATAPADTYSPLSPPPATTPADTSSSVEIVDADTFHGLQSVDRPEAEGCDANQTDECDSQASSAELLEMVDDDEEEEEEGEEAFEEIKAGVEGEDEGEQEAVVECLVQDHHSDSDTSDDFCVLDPPSASDVEENEGQPGITCKSDDGIHQTPEVPSMEMVDHVRAEGEAVGLIVPAVVDSQIDGPETLDAQEGEGEGPVKEEIIEAVEVCQPEAAVAIVTETDVVQSCNADEGKAAEACGGESEVKEEEDSAEESWDMQEDVLMNMTSEERGIFLDMVKTLKERALDLEIELKARKEAEAEEKKRIETEARYQLILEEKQREALWENEKLEQMQRKKEQEERLKRQQRHQEKERRLRQKKTSKDLKLSTGVSVGEGAKKKSRVSSSKPPTLMQMALNTHVKTKQVATRSAGSGDKQEASSSGQVTPPAGVQVDNIIYVQSGKKDANCQTSGRGVSGSDAAAHASQMIQNVASGVSKAAEAAFHTAKDVFYSLQAKQVEKKTYEGVVYSKTVPTNSKASPTDATATTAAKPGHVEREPQGEDTAAAWIPPSSVWTPPSDTFVPPKSEWTPPQSNWKPPSASWTPPKSEWTGPKSEWTPPQGFYQPPPLESDSKSATEPSAPVAGDKLASSQQEPKKEKGSDTGCTNGGGEQSSSRPVSSSPLSSLSAPSVPFTSPLSPIQITDPVLRREVQGMQLLIEMGFANREQNRQLLQDHEGDVERVVQSLLQEEREEHWAWGQRH